MKFISGGGWRKNHGRKWTRRVALLYLLAAFCTSPYVLRWVLDSRISVTTIIVSYLAILVSLFLVYLLEKPREYMVKSNKSDTQ
jgi:hypothetical protein